MHAIGPQPIISDAKISIRDYASLDVYNRFRIELFVQPVGKDTAAFYQSIAKLFHDLEYLDGDACLFFVDEEQMEDVQAYLEINDTLTLQVKQETKEFYDLELPYEKGHSGTNEDDFAVSVTDAVDMLQR